MKPNYTHPLIMPGVIALIGLALVLWTVVAEHRIKADAEVRKQQIEAHLKETEIIQQEKSERSWMHRIPWFKDKSGDE